MNTQPCIVCQTMFPSGITKRPKRFCSTKCYQKHARTHREPNITCDECKLAFFRFPSSINTAEGTFNFCSGTCRQKYFTFHFSGELHHRYKGVEFVRTGYQLACIGEDRQKFGLEHRKIACKYFEVDSIESSFHVHHRDCDKTHNSPNNLVLLSKSDHMWLHKFYGNHTLRAFMQGKIALKELISWADDTSKAERILGASILDQDLEKFGLIKDDRILKSLRPEDGSTTEE